MSAPKSVCHIPNQYDSLGNVSFDGEYVKLSELILINDHLTFRDDGRDEYRDNATVDSILDHAEKERAK